MRSILIELTSNGGKMTQFIRRDHEGFWDVYDNKGTRLIAVGAQQSGFAKIATDPVRMLHVLTNFDDMYNFAQRNNADILAVTRNALTGFLNKDIVINSVSI